jgi:putative transposase
MQTKPTKSGYAALRRFRESKSDAVYFVTTNLKERGHGLESSEMADRVIAEWRRIEYDGGRLVKSAVVMPDHVHLLVQIKGVESLAECMRCWKGWLSSDLRRRGLCWQEGFYEHRVQESENLLPVFLYIYLNPYRAGLVPETAVWAGYFCCPEDWSWFGDLTRESVPQPEWLR